jgi:hypothetical protein
MLPLATTTVTIERWSPSYPGQREVVATSPAVVGNVSGREQYAYKGLAPSGWDQMLEAKANTEIVDLAYGDLLTDDGTGQTYRVLSSVLRQGLGIDHQESWLARYAPTGLYSVLRGSVLDAYGDSVPTGVPVATGLEAEIREQQRDVHEDGEGDPGTTRELSARFPAGCDIQVQDTIRDEATGATFAVLAVGLITQSTPSDVGVDLRRITT